jgi:hypothetical protein
MPHRMITQSSEGQTMVEMKKRRKYFLSIQRYQALAQRP